MFSIQVFWLPSGTQIFGRLSSGADKEVCAPATLVLDPVGTGLRLHAQRVAHTAVGHRGAWMAGSSLAPRVTDHCAEKNPAMHEHRRVVPVERKGVEPSTSALRTQRSPN